MSTTVDTNLGPVQGVTNGPVTSWLGIPYAAAPVGELRFAAPAPRAPWSTPLIADTYGLACPQQQSALPGMAPGPEGDDCLSLNVFAPSGRGDGRPVMVWIHGGAFTTGSSGQALYQAERLVAAGDVVVVTVNYRLGAFGFLSLDGAPENRGLLDQVCALHWVRDNIAAFGGDPAQVTIFGESAGGMSVASLMALPAARGLFQRAIPQSGVAQATLSPEAAGQVSDAFANAVGAPATATALQNLPAGRLIEASLATQAAVAGQVFLAHAPVIDPQSLPVHPLEAVRRGDCADISLMTGTTADEWRLFSIAAPGHRELDWERVERRVTRRVEALGLDGAELLSTYRAERPAAEPWEVHDAIETDRLFRVPAIEFAAAAAAHQPATWMYRFDRKSPAARGRLGACHAIEIPYVFGTLAAPGMERFAGTGPEAEALSGQMMHAWTGFADAGEPGPTDLPDWPAWDPDARSTMLFADDCRVENDPAATERAAWSRS